MGAEPAQAEEAPAPDPAGPAECPAFGFWVRVSRMQNRVNVAVLVTLLALLGLALIQDREITALQKAVKALR